MKERYEALCELLDSLFRQLSFPTGGNVIVSTSGEVINCKTINEVETAFLMYFKSGSSIYAIAKLL